MKKYEEEWNTYWKWQARREPKEQASHKPFFDFADFLL